MDETQCCENGIFKYVRKGESENVFYQCRQKRRPDEGNWELICKFMLDEAVPFSELQSIQEVCDRMQDCNGPHRIQSTPLAHVRVSHKNAKLRKQLTTIILSSLMEVKCASLLLETNFLWLNTPIRSQKCDLANGKISPTK